MVNKVAITFALAAVFVAVYAVPAPEAFAVPVPKVDNWTAINDTVNELHNVIVIAIIEVKEISRNDNETIGSTIGEKLDEGFTGVFNIIVEIRAAIINESLTATQAEEKVDNMKRFMARTIGSVSVELTQLSQDAEQRFRTRYSQCFDDVELHAQNLNDQLGGTPGTTTADIL